MEHKKRRSSIIFMESEETKRNDEILSRLDDDDDEDEEEEKPKYPLKLRTNTRQETRDITPQFQCCVCHSNVYGEKEDSPCLLVHTDCDFHPCILFVKLS